MTDCIFLRLDLFYRIASWLLRERFYLAPGITKELITKSFFADHDGLTDFLSF